MPECVGLHRLGFNEAGADCPGMRAGVRPGAGALLRFNEAGADCPGMPIALCDCIDEAVASMRPGQTAPECEAFLFDEGDKASHASMRPGQTAPECCVLALTQPGDADASMRPGQTAPECSMKIGLWLSRTGRLQ